MSDYPPSEEFLFAEYYESFLPITFEAIGHEEINFNGRHEAIRQLYAAISRNQEIDKLRPEKSSPNSIVNEESDVALEKALNVLEDGDITFDLIHDAYETNLRAVFNPDYWFNKIQNQ
jgi:hypothetical protein